MMKVLAWLLALLLLAACAGAGSPTSPDAASTTPDTVAESVERGKVLFRNKGCVYCHVNDRVEGPHGEMEGFGPTLTNYINDPAFLQRWLADPPAVRPGTPMPNLRLSATEIEDLIAFLNEPR